MYDLLELDEKWLSYTRLKSTKSAKLILRKLKLVFWTLSDFIKNILICVLKMNEGLTGLERHESE